MFSAISASPGRYIRIKAHSSGPSSPVTSVTSGGGASQIRTTLYHPQSNGVVEHNNPMLGEALWSLLVGPGQEQWDMVLPEIMRPYCSTPYTPQLLDTRLRDPGP